MKHHTEEINFHKIEPMEINIYPSFFSDPSKVDDMKKYGRGLYYSEVSDDVEEFSLLYNLALRKAIKSNNIPGLSALWKAVYFHDRDHPNYQTDLETACTFSNLKTVEHVVYGFYNYATHDGLETPNFKYLSNLSKDPTIKKYILGVCATIEKANNDNSTKTVEEIDDSPDIGDVILEFTKTFNKENNVGF